MTTSFSVSVWEIIGTAICSENTMDVKYAHPIHQNKGISSIGLFLRLFLLLWQGWQTGFHLHVFFMLHLKSINVPDVNSSEAPQQLVMTTERENSTFYLKSSKNLFTYVISNVT